MKFEEVKNEYTHKKFIKSVESILPDMNAYKPIHETIIILDKIYKDENEKINVNKVFLNDIASVLNHVETFIVLKPFENEKDKIISKILILFSNFIKIKNALIIKKTDEDIFDYLKIIIERINVIRNTRDTMNRLNINLQFLLKRMEEISLNDSYTNKISGMYKSYLDEYFKSYREKDPTGPYDSNREDLVECR